ncbi:hypothetical protein GUITHDRAFT_111668 [Guillardia theta CCMP2712]|uniref:Uncharacterized protein n=1 Tax=Guillardia theta (strain CCMP2712) TaxID=905079 RepID=L1J1L0_GUITC|nr:hypothetical protein GUITHDRAFT_111668 [Guillardia theta CCMP2712]EKX42391.1 hypothetical protein GUITHDRAFT_111668 [Guillardia theta CCMP2712]|eukprot:XP_005829371.1 hypothetical protein GUITHDRAFT_111668 [Guillardia theta CCMP2712]
MKRGKVWDSKKVNDWTEEEMATRDRLPNFVRMLRPPQKIVSRSDQAKLLMRVPEKLTIEKMKDHGSSAYLDSLLDQIRACNCQIVRVNRGNVNEDQIVSIAFAIELARAKSSQESKQIEQLDVHAQHLSRVAGGALFSALAKLDNLMMLSLAKSSFPGVDIQPLSMLLQKNTLKTLDLTQTGMDDARGEVIASGLYANTSLTSLGLSANNLHHAGVLAISRSLRQHTAIRRLDLSLNFAGDQGATRLADILSDGAGVLEELIVEANEIGNNGAESLLSMVSREGSVIKRLSLRGNNIRSIGLPSCEAIMEARHLPLWAAVVTGRMQAERLEFIDLSKNTISNAALLGTALLRSKSMKHVDLSFNRISDTTFATAVRYWETAGQNPSNIRPWILDLSKRVRGSTASWSPLRPQLMTSSRLEYMDLTGNNITDDGALMEETVQSSNENNAIAYSEDRLRWVPPRFNLSHNLIQSEELLEALTCLDYDIPSARQAWLRYVRRRKEEFWENWDGRYGWSAQKARMGHLMYRMANSSVGRMIKKGIGHLRSSLLPQGESEFMVDEIELAEEAHRLRLEELRQLEEEAKANESRKAKKQELKESKKVRELLKEEYEKTGDKTLLSQLKGSKGTSALGTPSMLSTPRKNGGGSRVLSAAPSGDVTPSGTRTPRKGKG